MATPPLPDVPCVRVRCTGHDASNFKWGVRFYLSYSGSAPTGANCTTLATDVGSQWVSHLTPLQTAQYELDEVDVLDIATNSGFSGQATPSQAGTRAGNAVAYQVAVNVEYGIARRYRGGKPRMYFPGGSTADQADYANWGTSFISAVNSGVSAFFSAIEALSIGSMGTLQHVNLSYYSGYRTRTTGGGQTTFAPKYRTDNAKHDNVTGYFCKAEFGSQRRRRVSTTP